MKRLSLIAFAFCVPGLACWYPPMQEVLMPGNAYSGLNTQPPGSLNIVEGANWYWFKADAGAAITIWGDRGSGQYDMAFWVFSRPYRYPPPLWELDEQWMGAWNPSVLGETFDASDPGFLIFADNEDPPNLTGPFGDPRVAFLAPHKGWYTVAVTNGFSGAGPPNPYSLYIEGSRIVPEPSTLALAGLGILVLAILRGRRTA